MSAHRSVLVYGRNWETWKMNVFLSQPTTILWNLFILPGDLCRTKDTLVLVLVEICFGNGCVSRTSGINWNEHWQWPQKISSSSKSWWHHEWSFGIGWKLMTLPCCVNQHQPTNVFCQCPGKLPRCVKTESPENSKVVSDTGKLMIAASRCILIQNEGSFIVELG